MAEANQTVLKVLNDLKAKTGLGGVVDKWSDGQGNFWRKYADGWIEQGGIIVDQSESKIETLTFHTSFSNTSYSLFLSKQISSTDTSFSARAIGDMYSDKQVSSVKIFHWGLATNLTWFACGY